ncbi:hypothetical protein NCAS_0A00290 [Naumovozyma castellii]|uniref:Receptor L-domain domain-containing protein n=1 Tax=Naumovozyma castellii TaxID=27288 RepID=G0V553_NAUCA|nr:hypothetical protein NCAS_0A00290 [Naumovozyma castellii CBS 4309]CCC66589.1 hypothetical protein NCAS_0A00290 [Naumovozyma castellii CBS 4309]
MKILNLVVPSILFSNLAIGRKLPSLKEKLPSNATLLADDSKVHILPIDVDKKKAQNSTLSQPEICKKESHQISSAQELNGLQSQCTSVAGSIEIMSDYLDSTVDFGMLKNVEGGVKISNSPHIVDIQGKDLQNIHGTFTLSNLTSFVSLNLPSFIYTRAVEWEILPIFSRVLLNNKIIKVRNIVISDTALADIDCFKEINETDIFSINNNRFLETIESNINIINQDLTIHANAKDLEVDMSQLVSVKNLTIRDTAKVFFPKLEYVNRSFEIIENTFTELDVSNLKTIEGTLGLINNTELTKIDMNKLTTIKGGVMISNNTKLEHIDFLPNLRQIDGAIYFEGKFKDTDFPELRLVKGSAYIKSTSEDLDCAKWTKVVNQKSIIRGGKINCISAKREKAVELNNEGEVLKEMETSHELETNKTSTGEKKELLKEKSSGTILKPLSFGGLVFCLSLFLFH